MDRSKTSHPLILAALALAATTFGCEPIAVTSSDSGDTPVYGTFEVTLNAPGLSGNPFREFATVEFTRGDRSFTVEGFFDGEQTWRARFMPDFPGRWTYAWRFRGSSGEGAFQASVEPKPGRHGHVHRDPMRPRYLIHDDGTSHYWFGGKWINAPNYGNPSKFGETNSRHLTDRQLLDYLNDCRENRHNGLLLKVALFPVEGDGYSWDLSWIRRADWLVREMAERGIYCQINLFDTWSRDRGRWFEHATSGRKQILNAWSDHDEARLRNYVRYLVARFSGYYNVYWELGNEMEHSNDGDAFASLADAGYIPWIREFDPYGLPIGLSENIWKKTRVDIGFLHQTDEIPDFGHPNDRPLLMNELVRGCKVGSLWRDDVIRNPAARLCYRNTFWRVFAQGGSGSSGATWLSLAEPLDQHVHEVMADHRRLRDFIETLPVHLNDTEPDREFVISGPGWHRTRSKAGQVYVTYFLGRATDGVLSIDLPVGTFVAHWYDPSLGRFEAPLTVVSSGTPVSLPHPAFDEDAVLRVLRTERPE